MKIIKRFLAVALALACLRADGADTFYQTARFIMTKEEKMIYKHLPDSERNDFIEEFWRIRDSNPYTSENEFKAEFEERIKFANEYFIEPPKNSNRGWDTDRGRIYLLLGPPDGVWFSDGIRRYEGLHNRRITSWLREEWYYERYKLYLCFQVTHMGKLVLTNYPANLLTAIERVKKEMMSGAGEVMERRFMFDALYSNGFLHISIPLKRVMFMETDGKMTGRYRTEIIVYRDHQRVKNFVKTFKLKHSPQALLQLEFLTFKIPFKPELKGKYLLDIVIDEVNSGFKYRNYCHFKN